MNWSTRRKFLYGLATILILTSLSVYFLRDTLFPQPTCSDAKKNGFELDVDCGGTCRLKCQSEVYPLTTVWTRAIKNSDGRYDLAAMVSNKNINNASVRLLYTFTSYDEMGAIIATTTGSMVTPIDGDFPIVVQNVHLTKDPTTVALSFSDGPHYAVLENPASPILRISNIRYEAGAVPRVYATVQNTKRVDVRNVPVNVILYDENNNAYAVGTSLIDSLTKEESKNLVFVWKEALTQPPVKIRIYPLLNPFLNTK